PAVGALVELHDQLLRLAVVGNVRPAISIQIGHDQAGDALFRGDGINAKARVRRQFIQLAFAGSFDFSLVRFAGLVVEQVDLRPKIVNDYQVLQSITVQIGRAQVADLVVNRENFRAGESKPVR